MNEQECQAQLIVAIGNEITNRVKNKTHLNYGRNNSTRRTFFNFNAIWTLIYAFIFMLIFVVLTVLDLTVFHGTWTIETFTYIVFLVIGFFLWIYTIAQFCFLKQQAKVTKKRWSIIREQCLALQPIDNFNDFYTGFIQFLMRHEKWYDKISDTYVKLNDKTTIDIMIDSYNKSALKNDGDV